MEIKSGRSKRKESRMVSAIPMFWNRAKTGA
nr:MAG TPA: hypothetical protein [Caudoviricetes sp.]